MQGLFISMEGPDGAGKSTQIELLRGYLADKGYEIVITREPGGTVISEAIRQLILNREYAEMCPNTELLLYAAARAQLVNEVIRPALEAGKAVICDRFVESSVVYQGIARGMGIDTVYAVNEYALEGLRPQLTILLDLDAEEGLRRKKNQAELDRMEAAGLEFHRKVAEGYRMLAEREKERIMKISATLPEEDIHAKIVLAIEERILNRYN
ncbi:MAG: dTMP kinase [Lachnospiraceae bacterium]|nr:dTMP kinase [Lachnospiraceae bacterium]